VAASAHVDGKAAGVPLARPPVTWTWPRFDGAFSFEFPDVVDITTAVFGEKIRPGKMMLELRRRLAGAATYLRTNRASQSPAKRRRNSPSVQNAVWPARCRATSSAQIATAATTATTFNVVVMWTNQRDAIRTTKRQFLSWPVTRWNKPPSLSRRSAQLHLAEAGPYQKKREKRSQIHAHGSTVMPMKSA
jgi:hypothetical protein